MNHITTCEICETENPGFRWTDTHGIGQCSRCGAPYRLYHYEGETFVDKPPTCLVLEDFKPVLKQYWNETKRIIPGGYSFPGGQEMASQEEHKQFYDWLEAHQLVTKPEAQPEVAP